MEVLDHPAAVGDHARAGAVRPGLQDPARVVDGLLARRERGVGALDLAGVDQGLAVEAQLAALPALGQEAVGVLHVVVDAVEDRLAGRPRGQQRQRRGRSAAAARPGTCSAYSSLARSLVPITSTVSRVAAPRRSPRRGASRAASRPSPRAWCARARRTTPSRRRARAPRRRCSPWVRRSRRARRRRRPAGRRRATAVSAPLTRIVTSRRAVLAAGRRGAGGARARPAWRRARRRPRGRGSGRRRGCVFAFSSARSLDAGM